MSTGNRDEELARIRAELDAYRAYVERCTSDMLGAMEGVAEQRFDSFCTPERDDDSMGALSLGINMMISDIGEAFTRTSERQRELSELKDNYYATSMQLATGLAECVRVLAAVRKGDLTSRVGDEALQSEHDLVSTLGEALNTTLEELQQQLLTINQQTRAIKELSTPIIPIMDRILVMPLVGAIDTHRARDVMRALLTGITKHRARVVIIDITGVAVVDTGVANHLNKTVQGARLKGAHTIVTGISDAVAETIVELGIDWQETETLADLQSGLLEALRRTGVRLVHKG